MLFQREDLRSRLIRLIGQGRISAEGTDDQVGEAVTINVAGRGDPVASEIVGRHSAELESIGTVERGEAEIGTEHSAAAPNEASILKSPRRRKPTKTLH